MALFTVEIRPGEGGDDAAVFADQLTAVVKALCRLAGISVTETLTERRDTVLSLSSIPPALEELAGVHRIQRIPSNDKRGRRHTSTASLAVLTDRITEIDFDESDLKIEAYRGSGPGGQHRNKTDSAIRITHLPTGTVVTSERQRSQWQNIQAAKTELRQRLQSAANQQAGVELNEDRVGQIADATRPAKNWTWNDQRNEVLNHNDGVRYIMSDLLRGRTRKL